MSELPSFATPSLQSDDALLVARLIDLRDFAARRELGPFGKTCIQQILDRFQSLASETAERRALAIETFIKTVAGPAFSREDLREEAKHILKGTFPYTRTEREGEV